MKKLKTFTGATAVAASFLLLLGIAFARGGAAPQAPNDEGGNLSSGGPLKLNKGDHVALIGNTLADRMQHDGWFETLVYARFPQHDLVFRNLAVSGDEVVTRHRSQDFGSPDEWLAKVKADVILAFFGFNESFQGEEGLPKFKSQLDQFLKDTLKKNYSGKGAPRIVLFSPIANERHKDPNFPDPTKNNARIRLYSAAMAEVAKANNVQFVDLFAPSQQLYANAAKQGQSLTVNGIHLTPEGDRLLAPPMFRAVFDETAPEGNFEKLRAAVNDKNWEWHGRYRTVDGYNVYGGRSREAYEQGPGGPKMTNFKVMQEEMAQRDVLTDNRDPVVWAAAQGKFEAKPVDDNLPPVTPVKSNRRGQNPDGSFSFLNGEEAISKMKVAPGLKVNLFASEEQFPELVNPVQMAWDTKGRLWVSVWRNYPERTPTSKIGDSLLIFEDTDGDGRADKCIHYLDDLNCPTGFQFYKDGVLLMQAPDLWFVRDTDGDGKGDQVQRVLMGMDSADSHHTTNSMCYEPGGAVYLSDGVFHRTQVETADGPVRNEDACIYRFEPRTGKFERYVPYGFANPHGRVFDYWGNDIITDATGNNSYFAPAFSGHIDYPAKHKSLKQFWERPSRPCPGTAILTSRHFPDDWQGNFLNLNVISFQGVYRVKMKQEGSGIWGESLPDLISSSDPNFRPVGASVGADGALYLIDWHNPIIGHLQHHLRDPNRDHSHGRIYRITYEGRPLMKPAKIDGQPVPALLDLLKEPENQTRTLAKIELDKHDTAEVMSALKEWVNKLDKNDPAYEHHLTEALWLHQWHNVVDQDLLKRMLRSPEPNARAAATRVLCYWRDRVPDVLALLKVQAADGHPRVRLEAIRAASFFRTPEAVDVALASLGKPTDYYLDYTMGETLRQLEPFWRKALADGKQIAQGNPAGLKYLLGNLSAADLVKLPPVANVLETIVIRPDVPEAARGVALNTLAEQRKTTRANVLLALLDSAGKNDATTAAGLARQLPQQPTGDLKPIREKLMAMATGGKTPAERQSAWGAIALADESFDKVWPQAQQSPKALEDLLGGIPQIYDPDVRGQPYERVKALLSGKAASDAVRRAAITAAVSMQRDQKATFAALADLIERGEDVNAAARGMRALPRQAWDTGRTGNVAKALVAWAKKVPADDRTGQEYVEAVQFAGDLAGTLPAEQADALRKELKDLRVAVFVVHTVREQMRYDTTRLVVEAGKPFEVILQNDDFMPHNLTVVNPGSRPRVGAASARMLPDEIDYKGRAFIPRGRDVLDGTKLIEPGAQGRLKMIAPNREGDYEYVCTYPEHWQMMWGTLVVTKDVDAYLKAHPDAAPQQQAGAGAHQRH